MNPRYCKHYCGTVECVCEAGVNLRKHVGGPDDGWAARLPCNSLLGQRDPAAVVSCDKYEEPTPEEIADEEAFMAEMMNRTQQSIPWMESIKEAYKGKNACGVDKCPICGNVIYWSIAASNGHMDAECRTEGCLKFME